jgi:predicted Zn-dependent protease
MCAIIHPMTRFLRRTWLIVLTIVMLGGVAHAQEWRGMGRVGGKVVDEDTGQPVEGVTVKAMMPRSQNRGPNDSKSNSKGEWALGGLANGDWALDFSKDGYETRSISVPVSESGNRRPMEIKLKKKAAPPPDANAEIKAKLTDAATKMNAKQFAEARGIYEELSAKYPEVKQFRPLIARTYYGEGNKTAAIEQLRKAAAEDPSNIEVRLLLGTTLMEDGKSEEARQVLSSVDESKITDPTVFLNIGIGLINDKKHAEAVAWFDRAIARFPQHPDGYYYRGISKITLGKTAEAKADLEKYVSMAPPDAPELATAKQILASIR